MLDLLGKEGGIAAAGRLHARDRGLARAGSSEIPGADRPRSNHRSRPGSFVANPRNRAKRRWRWRAYHCRLARSLVRLALVASIDATSSLNNGTDLELRVEPPASARLCI